MTITFIEERKRKTQYLLIILVIGIFLIAFLVWRALFPEIKIPPLVEVKMEEPPKAEIDEKALDDLRLKELKELPSFPSFEGTPDRKYPFFPYYLEKPEEVEEEKEE